MHKRKPRKIKYGDIQNIQAILKKSTNCSQAYDSYLEQIKNLKSQYIKKLPFRN